MPARAKKLLSAGVLPRVPAAARPQLPVAGGGESERGAPLTFSSSDTRSSKSAILAALAQPGPRARQAGKEAEGWKPRGGAVAETRPGRRKGPPGNAEPEGAMSVTGAGAPESRLLCLK